MSPVVSITAAYAFFPLTEDRLPVLRDELRLFGPARGMKGLTLLAPEGINATVCGTPAAITDWKARLRELEPDIIFKDSRADAEIFRRWSVKIKSEIVAIKDSHIHPAGAHRHLSPEQWGRMLQRGDVIVLDTRNTYETAIGKFRGAIDPGITHFSQFPDYVRNAALPKDKTVLLYCTGGIRCEKAIVAMERQGFHNVHQLQGGILAYLEQCPHEDFEGECFVFDKRVAVDQMLRPSTTYRLCETCGNPVTASVSCHTPVRAADGAKVSAA